MLFPAAEPYIEGVLADVATAFASQAYVYLLRIKLVFPIANIPLVLLPAAEPERERALEDVAVQLVSLAYVYLFLVKLPALPSNANANIPRVEFPTADCSVVAAVAAVAAPLVSAE